MFDNADDTLSPAIGWITHITITHTQRKKTSAMHRTQHMQYSDVVHENSVKVMWMLKQQTVTGRKIIYLKRFLWHHWIRFDRTIYFHFIFGVKRFTPFQCSCRLFTDAFVTHKRSDFMWPILWNAFERTSRSALKENGVEEDSRKKIKC